MAPARVEDDPVTAEYDVFITPDLEEQLYLLQYPIRNRAQPYNESNGARPTEMRIKPNSGFMEIDVEMSTMHNFNKAQGLIWGKAMQKAQTNGVASFGAASGFGQGALPNRAGRAPRGGDNMNQYADGDIDRFNDALNNNQVFKKQTLGGQILKRQEGNPNYMLGAFRGGELHLTRVNGNVQMRPQFHHVDAVTHAEKSARERDNEEARPAAQARAMTQSYKDTRDSEDPRAQRGKNLMQLAQEEPWSKLLYYDEEDDESYAMYHDRLFVKETKSVGRLQSSMTNEEYLDAISAPRNDPSGPRKKKPLTRKQRAAIDLAEDDIEQVEEPPMQGAEA